MKAPTLFDFGFRVFFLCAALYSVLGIAVWTAVYAGWLSVPLSGLTPFQWHAHEMIFGYALAVIAGFLLTATANWTGIQTLHGWPLAGLAGLWVAARAAFLGGWPLLSGAIDVLFVGLLSVAVATPIIRVRQGRQAGILGKLFLFLPALLLVVLGVAGVLRQGVQWGNYAGLYLVIGLILMMGRRVVPMFIASGVDEAVSPDNPRWMDIASLLLFLAFFVAALLPGGHAVAGSLALALFVVNAWRLVAWHTPGIWRKPLVWVIYLGLWFVTIGFGLYTLAWLGIVPQLIAIHAFAYGGIGLMTLGMMARVSLGHTGRSIHAPPAAIQAAFGILLAGAVVRVFLPLLSPGAYVLWIGLSQGLWLLAFSLFLVVYAPMLMSPRVDTPPGA